MASQDLENRSALIVDRAKANDVYERVAHGNLKLPGAKMRERTSERGRSAWFDWKNGSTRVNVGFIAKGKAKGQVGLEHEHLPDARSAEKMKVFWRERLEAHKTPPGGLSAAPR